MAFADASVPLQKALVAALKANAAVNAIVAGRIYDQVPVDAVKPYLSFGPWQVIAEQGDCYDASDISVQIDGWSAGPGSIEAKKIGRAVRAALDQQQLALDENERLVVMVIEQTQYLVEPDGLTQHAVVSFIARTEPID
jgi:invasion protein IalB